VSLRLTPAFAFEPGRFLEPDCFASPAVGVGNSKQSSSLVRGSGVGSSKHSPANVIPQGGHVGEGSSPSEMKVRCDVLQHDDVRS